jgi:hypothetical protein
MPDRATDSAAGTTLTWSATGLPTGLSIATADGTITGSPTTAGEFSVTLTAADGSGATGSASFTWTVTSPVTVTNPGALSNVLGAAIAPRANTATDTQPGATFTWTATGLPAGLSIASATGTITGTPTAAGTYTVSLSATDSSGLTGTASFAWTITQASLSITPSSLPAPAVGRAYGMTLAAVGGAAPYSWSVSTGSLPAGLVLDGTTGAISGTPSLARPSTFTLTVTDGAGQTATQAYTLVVLARSPGTAPPAHSGIMASVPSGKGYWLASSNGTVLAFGSAQLYGSSAKLHLVKPVVALVPTSDAKGYWLVASDGGVFTFGDAHFYGSTAKRHLAKPIVGMVATPDAKGYWLTEANGAVFSFGDAHLYGSAVKAHLAKPIVRMVATTDAKGYWLLAANGAVFGYGDAHLYGSMAKLHLAKPIVGMTATADGKGYWLVAKNGAVFSYGDAHLYGSTAKLHLAKPITGITATPDGKGYWLVANGGTVFSFGDASFYGCGA